MEAGPALRWVQAGCASGPLLPRWVHLASTPTLLLRWLSQLMIPARLVLRRPSDQPNPPLFFPFLWYNRSHPHPQATASILLCQACQLIEGSRLHRALLALDRPQCPCLHQTLSLALHALRRAQRPPLVRPP